jgi:deoxyribonuclease-4
MHKFGFHARIVEGFHRAIEEAVSRDCKAVQMYTAVPNRFTSEIIDDLDTLSFFERKVNHPELDVYTHASYLLNLANPDPVKSGEAIHHLTRELIRSAQLESKGVVLHCGNHLGHGAYEAIPKFTYNLDRAIEESEVGVPVLLETGSGCGTSLGSSWIELEMIIKHSKFKDKLGVCLDTCHVWAAGIDYRKKVWFDRMLFDIEHHLGLGRVKLFHFNDARYECGDREKHETIGEGQMGIDPFIFLMHEPAFKDVPIILETPSSKRWGYEGLEEELAFLKKFAPVEVRVNNG